MSEETEEGRTEEKDDPAVDGRDSADEVAKELKEQEDTIEAGEEA